MPFALGNSASGARISEARSMIGAPETTADSAFAASGMASPGIVSGCMAGICPGVETSVWGCVGCPSTVATKP